MKNSDLTNPASSQMPFRVLRSGIIPNSQRLLDNSTYKIQFTLFLNYEFHYHLRFEHRIARFTTVLRTWYSSPYASNVTLFVFSLAHYQRVSLKKSTPA